MKKIMVRADDLGFSKAINYGIYETLKNGVIRNIGFMVNMPDSLHGYELVKDYDICLGQHTNVCTSFLPLEATSLRFPLRCLSICATLKLSRLKRIRR